MTHGSFFHELFCFTVLCQTKSYPNRFTVCHALFSDTISSIATKLCGKVGTLNPHTCGILLHIELKRESPYMQRRDTKFCFIEYRHVGEAPNETPVLILFETLISTLVEMGRNAKIRKGSITSRTLSQKRPNQKF